MTRISMTTREWHELVKPALPHTIADKDFPELGVVRIDPAAGERREPGGDAGGQGLLA